MARCASEPCTRWRPDMVAALAGVTVDGRWFCSKTCVERMARRRLVEQRTADPTAPTVPPMRLGVLLRSQGAITADQLHEALVAQRETQLKLGAQLRVLYGIEKGAILRALAAQAGTRYLTSIDPACVSDGPGGLAPAAVEALGLIPFSTPDAQGRIRVASTSPVRWAAVTALQQLTGWTPEPYLVEDDTWQALFAQYAAAASRTARGLQTAGTVPEAAARIAEAAARARRTTIVEARFDPHTWIRVSGDSSVHDVLLTPSAAEETAWQAVNISL